MTTCMPSYTDLWVFRKQFTTQFAASTFLAYVLFIGHRTPHRITFSRSSGNVYFSELMPCTNSQWGRGAGWGGWGGVWGGCRSGCGCGLGCGLGLGCGFGGIAHACSRPCNKRVAHSCDGLPWNSVLGGRSAGGDRGRALPSHAQPAALHHAGGPRGHLLGVADGDCAQLGRPRGTFAPLRTPSPCVSQRDTPPDAQSVAMATTFLGCVLDSCKSRRCSTSLCATRWFRGRRPHRSVLRTRRTSRRCASVSCRTWSSS